MEKASMNTVKYSRARVNKGARPIQGNTVYCCLECPKMYDGYWAEVAYSHFGCHLIKWPPLSSIVW